MLINNRYQLIKEIGRGGMAKVYLALDCHLKKEWAIKVIDDQTIIYQALLEAELMKKIDHHLLPRIVDVINNHNTLYIVMDYIKGVTLQQVIERHGPQAERQVINWARQICQVIHYLHQLNPPIIYCDLKPENIILKQDGSIRLIDLGIGYEINAVKQLTTQLWATEAFAAPEQLTHTEPVDVRTDVYCLGMTMSYLLTGKQRIDQEQASDSSLTEALNSTNGLNWLIQKATQKQPNKRYATILALARDLRHYQKFQKHQVSQMRSQFFRFVIIICLGLFSLSIGLLSFQKRADMLDDQYHKILNEAQKVTNQSQQLALYQSAIELQPQKQQAYLKLIESYRQDAIFTEKEFTHFTQILTANNPSLQIVADYGKTAYQLALLCWYDYEKPNQRRTKAESFMTMAKRDAKQNSKFSYKVNQYQKLVKIISEIEATQAKFKRKSLYLSYWQLLTQLEHLAFESKATELWELLKLEDSMVGCLEASLSDFKSSGVNASELIASVETTIVHLNHLAARTTEVEQTNDRLKNRLKIIVEKIFKLYQID